MNDILIGSEKLLTTGNYMMEDNPGGVALKLSQNMTPVNKVLAQINIMTTKSPYVPAFNPFSKSINVQSDSQQSATVTTAITSPIMSQVPLGVGSNPGKQTIATGDKTVLQEDSGCKHKETRATAYVGCVIFQMLGWSMDTLW